jgi:hypothetical protein
MRDSQWAIRFRDPDRSVEMHGDRDSYGHRDVLTTWYHLSKSVEISTDPGVVVAQFNIADSLTLGAVRGTSIRRGGPRGPLAPRAAEHVAGPHRGFALATDRTVQRQIGRRLHLDRDAVLLVWARTDA